MTKVIIRRNAFDPSSDETYSVAKGTGVGTFLMDWFDQWPATAVLYQNVVDAKNRIELKTEADVDKLNDLKGTIYVVLHPAGFALVGLALIGATVAISQLSKKKQSSSSEVAEKESEPEKEAPNNSLSERSNSARIGGRIPDIYGTIRAIPDLIAQPYRYFDDYREVEHSYLCLGRGMFTIWDVRQDETDVADISKNIYEIYGPDTSPNYGTPQQQQGSISEEFIDTKKIESFSGRELVAPNQPEYLANVKTMSLTMDPTGGAAELRSDDIAGYDLTEYFSNGGPIDLTSSQTCYINRIDSYYDYYGLWMPFATTQITSFNVADTGYTIDTVTPTTIKLDNPASVNAAWTTMATYLPNRYIGAFVADGPPPAGKYAFTNHLSGGGNTKIIADSRDIAESRLVGPIVVDDGEGLLINFTAPGGLYYEYDNYPYWNATDGPHGDIAGRNRVAIDVDVKITLQEVTPSNTPIGSPTIVNIVVPGSNQKKSEFGYTHRMQLPSPGRYQVTIERTSDNQDVSAISNFDVAGEVKDELQLHSLYSTKAITKLHFGDVTTIRNISYASSRQQGSRKLNMRVSRKIPRRISGTDFTAPEATALASDIIVAIATDPKLGGRSLDELDLDSIYTALVIVTGYFGTSKAAAFNYSFDDDNLSLEEMLGIVAEAVFCVPYRQTEKLKLLVEQEQLSSVLLFNHRNKIPGSENRSVSFGILEDKDGVEIEYANEDDNKPERIYLPENQSAVNAENVKLLGVIHKVQAHFHAHRYRNRQLLQNTSIEFDALQEANMLIRMNRIQVADNTRSETWDGQIEDQDGTTLLLSQEFVFQPGSSYTIFIQNTNGTVQAIGISPGVSSYEIELDGPTTQPLSTSDSAYAKATYQIVENGSLRKQAFLIEEKTPKEGLLVGIKAFNYEDGYYTNDKDYINGVVDIFGEPI